MNNKAVKTLLDKVKEFEDFFNEYEKQFYPKVIKIRNKFNCIYYSNVGKLWTHLVGFW